MKIISFLTRLLMKIIVLILMFFWVQYDAQAQSPKDRIQQDATLMQGVLDEIFKANGLSNSNRFFDPDNNNGKYEEGFGIILQVPFTGKSWNNSPYTAIISPRPTGTGNNRAVLVEGSIGNLNGVLTNLNQTRENVLKAIDSLSVYFLQNYGDLARGLNPEEWVMIEFSPSKNSQVAVFSTFNQGEGNPNASASIKVKYKFIDSYKEGNLTENQFHNNIIFVPLNPEAKENVELKIFSKILQGKVNQIESYFFEEEDDIEEGSGNDGYKVVVKGSGKTIYSNSNPRSYFIATGLGKISYKDLPGYGVVYTADLKSALGYRSLLFVSDTKKRDRNEDETIGIDQLGKKEWNEKVVALQTKSREEFKQVLIEYGRTLRSLPSDNYVRIVIEFPYCYDCELPASIEYRVKKSTLEAYDNRKLSYENAIAKIEEFEKGKAKDDKPKFGLIRTEKGKTIWKENEED